MVTSLLTTVIVRTSQEWQDLHPEVEVYDADGWDRKNLEKSWNEPISLEEYQRRLCASTCCFKGEAGKRFMQTGALDATE